VVISWLGLAYQYRSALTRKKEDPQQEEKDEKGKTKTGQKAEKEK